MEDFRGARIFVGDNLLVQLHSWDTLRQVFRYYGTFPQVCGIEVDTVKLNNQWNKG